MFIFANMYFIHLRLHLLVTLFTLWAIPTLGGRKDRLKRERARARIRDFAEGTLVPAGASLSLADHADAPSTMERIRSYAQAGHYTEHERRRREREHRVHRETEEERRHREATTARHVRFTPEMIYRIVAERDRALESFPDLLPFPIPAMIIHSHALTVQYELLRGNNQESRRRLTEWGMVREAIFGKDRELRDMLMRDIHRRFIDNVFPKIGEESLGLAYDVLRKQKHFRWLPPRPSLSDGDFGGQGRIDYDVMQSTVQTLFQHYNPGGTLAFLQEGPSPDDYPTLFEAAHKWFDLSSEDLWTRYAVFVDEVAPSRLEQIMFSNFVIYTSATMERYAWGMDEKVTTIQSLIDAYVGGGYWSSEVYRAAAKMGLPRAILADCVQLALTNLPNTPRGYRSSNAPPVLLDEYNNRDVYNGVFSFLANAAFLLPGGPFLAGAVGFLESVLGGTLFGHEDSMSSVMAEIYKSMENILRSRDSDIYYAHTRDWNKFLLETVPATLAQYRKKNPGMFHQGGECWRLMQELQGTLSLRTPHSLRNIISEISATGNPQAYKVFILAMNTALVAESLLVSLDSIANFNAINRGSVVEFSMRAKAMEEYTQEYHEKIREYRVRQVTPLHFYCVYWFPLQVNRGFEFWDEGTDEFIPSAISHDERRKFWWDDLIVCDRYKNCNMECDQQVLRHWRSYQAHLKEAEENRNNHIDWLKRSIDQDFTNKAMEIVKTYRGLAEKWSTAILPLRPKRSPTIRAWTSTTDGDEQDWSVRASHVSYGISYVSDVGESDLQESERFEICRGCSFPVLALEAENHRPEQRGRIWRRVVYRDGAGKEPPLENLGFSQVGDTEFADSVRI